MALQLMTDVLVFSLPWRNIKHQLVDFLAQYSFNSEMKSIINLWSYPFVDPKLTESLLSHVLHGEMIIGFFLFILLHYSEATKTENCSESKYTFSLHPCSELRLARPRWSSAE